MFSTGLTLLVVAAPSFGHPVRKPPCDAHRHGALVITRQVVVYATRRPYPPVPGSRQTVYHACLPPSGSSVEVGANGPNMDPYLPDATTTQIRVAGTYVAASSSSGQGTAQECAKYGSSQNCPSPSFWVRVIETKTRRHANLPRGQVPSSDANSAITVSPRGAVAWLDRDIAGGYDLEAAALHPQGQSSFTASPTALDTGNIDPHSLRFVGRTLHWSRDGVAHQQNVK